MQIVSLKPKPKVEPNITSVLVSELCTKIGFTGNPELDFGLHYTLSTCDIQLYLLAKIPGMVEPHPPVSP